MTHGMDWEKAARRDAMRSSRAPQRVEPWWWIVGRGGKCSDCERYIGKGKTVAYFHAEKTALCPGCAKARDLHPKASKAWKASR